MSIPINYSYSGESLERVLEDLLVRFVINCPQEDLSTVERLFFQIEEAQWYYLDYVRYQESSLPSLKMKAFSNKILEIFPYVWKWGDPSDAVRQFGLYKSGIPVRGDILLNKNMSKVLLVKGMGSNSAWGFPRGKISKDESDESCAIREVYEEIGFDIKDHIRSDDYIDRTINGKNHKMFILKNIPLDTVFVPQTRNEIGQIEWHDIKQLNAKAKARNNNYVLVSPFLRPLSKEIKKKRAHNQVADELLRVQNELKKALGMDKDNVKKPIEKQKVDPGRELLNLLHMTSRNKASGNDSSQLLDLVKTTASHDQSTIANNNVNDSTINNNSEPSHIVNNDPVSRSMSATSSVQAPFPQPNQPINILPMPFFPMPLPNMFQFPMFPGGFPNGLPNGLPNGFPNGPPNDIPNNSYPFQNYNPQPPFVPPIAGSQSLGMISPRASFQQLPISSNSNQPETAKISNPVVVLVSEPTLPTDDHVTGSNILPDTYSQTQDHKSLNEMLQKATKNHNHSKSGELLGLLTRPSESPSIIPAVIDKPSKKPTASSSSSNTLLSLLNKPSLPKGVSSEVTVSEVDKQVKLEKQQSIPIRSSSSEPTSSLNKKLNMNDLFPKIKESTLETSQVIPNQSKPSSGSSDLLNLLKMSSSPKLEPKVQKSSESDNSTSPSNKAASQELLGLLNRIPVNKSQNLIDLEQSYGQTNPSISSDHVKSDTINDGSKR